MAFIAGESLLFFLPKIPLYWMSGCFLLGIGCIYFFFISKPLSWLRQLAMIAFIFILGFAWNARYAENRLHNILSPAMEGSELVIEGRVAALPQGNSEGAKFAFELDDATGTLPQRIYLSWQPAWRNPQAIPEIIPGQRWEFKVKLKRPYGSLNPYTFDFERWSFHQDFGASGNCSILTKSDFNAAT